MSNFATRTARGSLLQIREGLAGLQTEATAASAGRISPTGPTSGPAAASLVLWSRTGVLGGRGPLGPAPAQREVLQLLSRRGQRVVVLLGLLCDGVGAASETSIVISNFFFARIP